MVQSDLKGSKFEDNISQKKFQFDSLIRWLQKRGTMQTAADSFMRLLADRVNGTSRTP